MGNRKIEYITDIEAPIEDVWKVLIDVNDWSWNKWAAIEAGAPTAGLKGHIRICVEGDGKKWETFPFEFVEVNRTEHVLSWTGPSYGPIGACCFKGYHVMKLEKVSATTTRFVHSENLTGIVPLLFWGTSMFVNLDTAFRLQNEALKAHVEHLQRKRQQASE
jgi:hypothetical protein